ncbi:BTB domain-containing protein [Mycena chlorophos]|uniref:BTB domain-containing protein n=1 Tax=Mycena chlorophos TaxID=658473 RepID=A0A8H6VZW1_MYCCL|nr:BTB domain-containing protein [Mycena chlorophos]
MPLRDHPSVWRTSNGTVLFLPPLLPQTSMSDTSMASPPVEVSTPQQPVKDEKYYFEKGDCTFLVQGVLFKLTRFQLSRDPQSFFAVLFADANGDASEVIELDDSVEDFRALCWAIYSGPIEMYNACTVPSTVEVKTYLRIIDIAHKYVLPEYETWAWLMSRGNGGALDDHLATCSEAELEHMLDLGIRCESSVPDLVNLVELTWVTRTRNGSVSCEKALNVGRTHNRPHIQAATYLHLHNHLMNGVDVPTPDGDFSYLGLSKPHLRRLLFWACQDVILSR